MVLSLCWKKIFKIADSFASGLLKSNYFDFFFKVSFLAFNSALQLLGRGL